MQKVHFTNCTIENYSAICQVKKLTHLYFYISSTTQNAQIEANKICDENIGIINGEFPNLEYFGIYGKQTYIDNDGSFGWSARFWM